MTAYSLFDLLDAAQVYSICHLAGVTMGTCDDVIESTSAVPVSMCLCLSVCVSLSVQDSVETLRTQADKVYMDLLPFLWCSESDIALVVSN